MRGKMNERKGLTINEIKNVRFKDKRLKRRCKKVIKAMIKNPSGSIGQMGKGWSEAKGIYRFFDNTRVTREILLESHHENTAKRIAERQKVAVIQDTTYVIVKQKDAQDFGPIGRRKENLKGLIVHSALAVDVKADETLGLKVKEKSIV